MLALRNRYLFEMLPAVRAFKIVSHHWPDLRTIDGLLTRFARSGPFRRIPVTFREELILLNNVKTGFWGARNVIDRISGLNRKYVIFRSRRRVERNQSTAQRSVAIGT